MARIMIEGKDGAVDTYPGETMLTALHRTGFSVLSGCRRGGCGVCKVDIVSGEVEYTHVIADKVLSEDDKAAGVCLTCRAVPATDVVVRARPDNPMRKNPLASFYEALNLPLPEGMAG